MDRNLPIAAGRWSSGPSSGATRPLDKDVGHREAGALAGMLDATGVAYVAELTATAAVKTVDTKRKSARDGTVFAREIPNAPATERKAAA